MSNRVYSILGIVLGLLFVAAFVKIGIEVDKPKPKEKQYKYSIFMNHFLFECSEYHESSVSSTLFNCDVIGFDGHVDEIRNAVNVIVEEIK